MGLQPRAAQMRDHKRAGYAAIGDLDAGLKTLVTGLVVSLGSQAAVALALNVRASMIANYLGTTPHKSVIGAVQMMTRRYYQRQGPVSRTLANCTIVAAGTVT